MRILVAPDCFTGTLTAPQAAEAMAEGWRRGAPHDQIVLLPLADGGPGFLEAVRRGLGGELVPTTVPGPLGEPAPAAVLLVEGERGRTAYVESAHAIGLHLVPAGRRDPGRTSSYGLGLLLRTAIDLDVSRVVVGLGGSATNDAGAGLLAGLGLEAAVLRDGGEGLAGAVPADLAGLRALRDELAGIDLVIATDVDVPLLGLHGASAGFAQQKGADPEQAQRLERALGHWAQVVAGVAAEDAPRPSLLAPAAGSSGAREAFRSLTQLPGAGAAGGAGFALALLGGRVLPGARVVAEAVGLGARMAESDLVLTGEGTLDWQSLHGKVVAAVAAQGLEHAVPVVAVAGQVAIGRREWGAAGLAGVYALAERPEELTRALAAPAESLVARVARVARTWSR